MGPTPDSSDEAWKKECELRALRDYQRRLKKPAWIKLWHDIAKARGQGTTEELAASYRAFIAAQGA